MTAGKKRDVTITWAGAADLDWLDTHDGYASRTAIARKIAEREILLARVDGERAGLLRIEYLWTTKPCISQLRVLEAFRRQGIAGMMLSWLEAQLGAAGHAYLISSTMPDNLISQTWHRQHGFEEIGFLAGINEGGIGEIFYRKKV